MNDILSGVFIGIGASASWAIICFLGRCLKIFRVRMSFEKSIEIHSGAGGVDYQHGSFIVMIRNRTPWDLVVRSIAVSPDDACKKQFPLKHKVDEDITALQRVVIPPEWGETWRLTLQEKTEPRSGVVRYESEGFWGGIVIRSKRLTSSQVEDIRKTKIAALDGRQRLDAHKKTG